MKNPTQAEIEFLRRQNGIRAVELHKMPTWWMERVCWATRGWGRHDAWAGMQAVERDLPVKLIDHWGRSVGSPQEWDDPWWCDGPEVFVCEPYLDHRAKETWTAAASVGQLLGVHFRILPPSESWWGPGLCARIEFVPCSHTPICRTAGVFSRDEAKRRAAERRRNRSKAPARNSTAPTPFPFKLRVFNPSQDNTAVKAENRHS